jgi:hypothetical protein
VPTTLSRRRIRKSGISRSFGKTGKREQGTESGSFAALRMARVSFDALG